MMFLSMNYLWPASGCCQFKQLFKELAIQRRLSNKDLVLKTRMQDVSQKLYWRPIEVLHYNDFRYSIYERGDEKHLDLPTTNFSKTWHAAATAEAFDHKDAIQLVKCKEKCYEHTTMVHFHKSKASKNYQFWPNMTPLFQFIQESRKKFH